MLPKTSIEAHTAALLARVMQGLSLEPSAGREAGIITSAAIRAAAEGLLSLPDKTFAEFSELRRPELANSLTGEWSNPLLVHLFNIDQQVWDIISLLRPSFAGAKRPEDAELRESLLTSVVVALTPPDAAPDLAAQWKQEAGPTAPDADDLAIAEQRRAFLQRYWKLRPPHLKTQADVAKAAGVHVNTIVAIEKFRGRPHYATIAKLARAFGVSPQELAPIP